VHSFAELAALLDYQMLVVTAADGTERDGCLVGFSSQSSIDPPRFLVGLSDKNRTTRIAQRSDLLAVHFLTRDQRALAELFGGETGDERDKLAEVEWSPGPAGVPLLADCRYRFCGRVLERVALGDHIAHLLEPDDVVVGEGRPEWLTFQLTRDIDPGHEA
jgi:flavin reductase (DIM6/NTAB) family NADH-FMN oxidoreductase RutF